MAWSSRMYGRSLSAQAAASCVATINLSSAWGQTKVERHDCRRPQNGSPNKHLVPAYVGQAEVEERLC